MSLGTILLIVLILLLVGAIPTWPHSKAWATGPAAQWGWWWSSSSCFWSWADSDRFA